ncbi:hypothetical protein FE257_012950 [Aspergillus nanangensis]|uniref:Uncharacterized protein n=1 Tax=Aspergillus nanangensis TaxID=2582783 RepID=A0AAD4CFQ8_ASPNN|nr:hypothetical protein FE257_012950 [Aspergillus nanangensis]
MKTPIPTLLLTLWSILVLLTVVIAIDIHNYQLRNCEGNFARCNNIRPCHCCTVAHEPEGHPPDTPWEHDWVSSSYHDLDSSDQAGISTLWGKKYKLENGHHDPHEQVCLNLAHARSSFWFRNQRPHCRREQACPWIVDGGDHLAVMDSADAMNSTQCALCDEISIDNHLFKVNYDVSANVTAALMRVWNSGGGYDRIPEEIRLLEVKK